MPSFTRSGRPFASFFSSSPFGSTSTALRVSSAIPTPPSVFRTGVESCLSRASAQAPQQAGGSAPAQAPDPQAPPARAHGRVGRAGDRGVLVRPRRRGRCAAERARSARTSRTSRSTATSTPATATRSSRCSAARRAASLVPSQDISPWMKQAIVATEDKRFWEHRGDRRPRHGPRALGGRPPPGRGAGRLDDHAAVRQELATGNDADDHAEAEGGGARVAARAALDQGQDPHRVPEHHLLRERRVRHRAGGANVLRAHTPRG